MGKDDVVIINGWVRKTTDKAVLVKCEEVDGVSCAADAQWFPKSKVPELDGDWEEGDEVEFECPEWLADEKDLI